MILDDSLYLNDTKRLFFFTFYGFSRKKKEEIEYVQFGGITLPASILQTELFQDRPEVAAWLVQQILQQQEEEVMGMEATQLDDSSSSSATSVSASSSALLAGPNISQVDDEDEDDVE